MVTPSSVHAPLLPLHWVLPVPLDVRFPFLTIALSYNTTVEPTSAWIVPPVLVNVPPPDALPSRTRVPPFVASIVPVFVKGPLQILMYSGDADWFAFTMCWLIKVLLQPGSMVPPPWIVL